jgi:hypothetical protein
VVVVAGTRELATQAVVVVVITGSQLTTQGNALVEVVLDTAANGGHRIPTVMLHGARIRRVTNGTQAAEHVRTPCRTLVAEEPATGHAEADAFPFATRAERIVLEVGIVVGDLCINGEIR